MFQNYFLTAFRNLRKRKGFSFLNIVGLAIGMASCILLLQYVLFEFSYDNFHENADNIYRLRYDNYRNNELRFSCAAAVAAVGQAYKDNFPEVVDYTKLMDINSVIRFEEKVFREQKVQLATPSFLTMFDWNLVKGNAETALVDANTAVISESTARKYFGDQDPMGKHLKVDEYGDFTVTGVFKDVPVNSHIKFHIMLSFRSLSDHNEGSLTSWHWYDFNTYIQLEDGTDPDAFFEKSNNWLQEKFEDEFAKGSRMEFMLQPIRDIHLYSDILEEAEPEENGNGNSVYFLLIIAGFILVIAWINYINMATSQAMNRSKEVGIRKVVGASYGQLVGQFIVESLLVNAISLVVAIFLTILAIPVFENVTGTMVNLQLFSNMKFGLGLLAVFIIGALISAIYPAFILSSFDAVRIFKSKIRSHHKGINLRKVLVVFQFAISVVLIAGTVIVFRQMSYLQKKDLGFDISKTLVVWAPSNQDSLYSNPLNRFKEDVMTLPAIKSFTASTNIPGDVLLWSTSMRRQEAEASESIIYYIIGMDQEYITSYDIELVAGRNFDDSDTENFFILINTESVATLGYNSPEDAIGGKVTVYGEVAEIIGVIDSYNQMSLKSNPIPLAYFHNPNNSHKFFSIKLNESTDQTTISQIKNLWNSTFEDEPFDYFYLDEFYNRQYTDDNQFGKSFALFSFLAIAVACLGLYGLSAFTVMQRTKEIGVRKVMGSTVGNIVILLAQDFMKLVIIANVIAIPATYYIMKVWLQGFAYRITIDYWIFIVSSILVISIAFLTVGYHTFRAANVNPVNCLRSE
jgi:putative ABC transport system permease protein